MTLCQRLLYVQTRCIPLYTPEGGFSSRIQFCSLVVGRDGVYESVFTVSQGLGKFVEADGALLRDLEIALGAPAGSATAAVELKPGYEIVSRVGTVSRGSLLHACQEALRTQFVLDLNGLKSLYLR